MLVDDRFCVRESTAIDQTRVIQFIREDNVGLESCNRSHVGCVSRGKRQRALGRFRLGEQALEVAMNHRIAGDETARTRACTDGGSRLSGRILDALVGRQPQIVVRTEHQRLIGVENR